MKHAPRVTAMRTALGKGGAVVMVAITAIASVAPGKSVAQTPPNATSAPAAPVDAAAAKASLDALAWLRGCWGGNVNQREFREMWLAPAGGMMLGVGQTVLGGKTSDYEHLRIEEAADGSLVYVLAPPRDKELAFPMTSATPEEFVFVNPELQFPRRIVYHRGEEGWLYASAQGKVGAADKTVVYPMRHVDCDSGELIRR